MFFRCTSLRAARCLNSVLQKLHGTAKLYVFTKFSQSRLIHMLCGVRVEYPNSRLGLLNYWVGSCRSMTTLSSLQKQRPY